MRKAVFICVIVLMSLQMAFADSIDNMLLDSLRNSKQEAKEKKDNANNKTDSTESIDNDAISKETHTSNQAKKSDKHSPFSINNVENKSEKEEKLDKRVAFFLGFGGEMQQADKSHAKGDSLIGVGLQIGAFTYITKAQAFRFALIANYNSVSNEVFYSMGGTIDYFYNIEIKGNSVTNVGIFAGSAISMPIASNLYKSANISARVGIGATMLGTNIEFYVGYPFYQDSNLHSILTLGINCHYLFSIK